MTRMQPKEKKKGKAARRESTLVQMIVAEEYTGEIAL